MNDASGSTWTGDHFDPMNAPGDHDFANLIDFENIDLDFSLDYTNAPGNHDHDASQQLSDLADSLHFSPQVSQEQHRRDGGVAVQQQHQQHQLHQQHHNQQQQQQQSMPGGIPHHSTDFFDFSLPSQYGQHGAPAFSQPQDLYRPHAHVPPTPNSVEMHGDPTRYLQQQMENQQAMFDPRYQLRKEDASFTPLVSPAVTPHEVRYQLSDFTTVPGAYFSPLTSPALNAQSHHQAQPHPSHASQYTTSGSSTGTSPVDVEMDLGEAAMPQSQPEPGRKLRSNKRAAPRSTNSSARVRQSPIVKPGRRKATVSSLIPPKEVSELVEEAQRSKSRPSSSGLEVPRSCDSSELSSVSPEPLTEMGPPPKPGSVSNSPAIFAQSNKQNGPELSPATPASLMRLQKSPSFGVPSDVPPPLDDLLLPEASLERPPLSRLDTTLHDDDQSTPRMHARKTPKMTPLSTPSGPVALSGRPSPMLSAVASPTSPAFFSSGGKRLEPKTARNTKKRNSVSSTLVSPALRPKISPSIKPLLPDGGAGTSDDTHAMLLASKSNYQNILDGTTVPGVVYPTSLSTNLTSKRTSHKIAEQGRRNRINTALQEMQALLPSPRIAAMEAKSPELSSAAQSNNSKAAKVESAIEYIRELQKECSDKDKLLNQKDTEMEALRKELAALKGDRNEVMAVAEVKTDSSQSSTPSTENAT